MWVVTVHTTGGGMGEAIDVQWATKLPNQQAAESFAEVLNKAFEDIETYFYAQAFEVPALVEWSIPTVSNADVVAAGQPPLEEGQVAFNMMALAEMFRDGEHPERVNPVTNDEEEAAIKSILGGTDV